MFVGSDELQRRTTITAQAKSDGLQLLRAINETQAHGQEGARVDPARAAHEAGLDVGSDRYHRALAYLLEEAALLGDEHTATEAGAEQHHGYALYYFTRRALKLLKVSERSVDLNARGGSEDSRRVPVPSGTKYSDRRSRSC